jgi:hypothetical protein
MIGAGTLALGLGAISAEADGLVRVGDAFANIKAVLTGSREDYAEIRNTIDAIAAADFSNLKALTNLNQLFSQPLQVQFAEREIGMVANITLEIDGDKFVENLGIGRKVEIMQVDYKNQFIGPKTTKV